MIGMGTIANVLAILAGGGLGLLFRGGLKPRWQEAVTRSLGLCVLFVGAGGALSGLLSVSGSRLVSGDTFGMILALSLGTLLGEWMDLEGWLERLGIFLREKAAGSGDERFLEGFVTASLVVCVGAMAVVGSIQDGLTGDPSTLYTKSILDFLIILVFASSYGKGVLFSALPVGVLQGSITLCAGLVAPLFQPQVVESLSFIGSILIFCVGINLAFGSRFRVANMLPALVVGGVYTAVLPLLPL